MEEQETTVYELRCNLIEQYIKLQRIEHAENVDKEIAIQKKELKAKLSNMGVAVEKLEIL